MEFGIFIKVILCVLVCTERGKCAAWELLYTVKCVCVYYVLQQSQGSLELSYYSGVGSVIWLNLVTVCVEIIL